MAAIPSNSSNSDDAPPGEAADAEAAQAVAGAPVPSTEGLSARFLALPWLAALSLSWTVGVVDAFTFSQYGVFTSNQAGNLVIIATGLPAGGAGGANGGNAVLSLLGACLGVVVGMAVGRRFLPSNPMQVGTVLLLSAGLLIAAVILDLNGEHYPHIVIPTVSCGLAIMATGLLHAPALRGWITANTGTLLTAVKGLTTPRKGKGFWRGMSTAEREGVIVSIGFFLGALAYGLGLVSLPHPILVGIVPTLVVIGLSLSDLVRRRREV